MSENSKAKAYRLMAEGLDISWKGKSIDKLKDEIGKKVDLGQIMVDLDCGEIDGYLVDEATAKKNYHDDGIWEPSKDEGKHHKFFEGASLLKKCNLR